jgi:hypothetical protein
MQFLQEFLIEQGVIFTRTGPVLNSVLSLSGNGGRKMPGLGRGQSLKNGVLGGVGSGSFWGVSFRLGRIAPFTTESAKKKFHAGSSEKFSNQRAPENLNS